jgi:acylglycerol lipase
MDQSVDRGKAQINKFKEPGGLNIAFRSWQADAPAHAVVIIIPGFNSHSGYYQWTAEQLTANGISAYAIDLRGRGESDGDRFYVESFADYVSDVASLVELVISREPRVALFMLGHSAGGVVACLYALEHQAKLKGLICESFAHELPAPDFALAALKGLSHLAPHAHVLRLKNEDFSRDANVVQAMNNDLLIADESQPTRTLAALVRADSDLKKGFSRITLPILIVHGTADKAAKWSGSQHFYEKAGSVDKKLKLYDGAYHDLLNDRGKERVIADIKDWIDGHLSA